jgi:hypothetical protein
LADDPASESLRLEAASDSDDDDNADDAAKGEARKRAGDKPGSLKSARPAVVVAGPEGTLVPARFSSLLLPILRGAADVAALISESESALKPTSSAASPSDAAALPPGVTKTRITSAMEALESTLKASVESIASLEAGLEKLKL